MIHRTLAGAWSTCTDPGCELVFHLPDASLAEVAETPLALLLPVLNAIQPPEIDAHDGTRMWLEAKPEQFKLHLHRDYDLPAVIYPDGGMEWWQHGAQHRADGGPALIRGVERAWYWHGEPHREGGPAMIYEDGREEWWLNGQPLPAPATGRD